MKKLLIIAGAAAGITVAVIAAVLLTFDLNSYKKDIETALSKELGRAVHLGGDIHAGLSSGGLTLSVRDVSFANPSWASRANIAGVGLFTLKIDLLALLSHRIDIGGLAIENADILLESQDATHHNWDMTVSSPPSPTQPKAAAKTEAAAAPVAINITSLSVKNSQIGIIGVDKTITVFKAENLTLASGAKGVDLDFKGELNNLPIMLTVVTDDESLMSKKARPVDLDLTFATYHLKAKGVADIAGSRAKFDSYELTAGDSRLAGHLAAAWGGVRPQVEGTVEGGRIAPDDFKIGGPQNAPAKPAAPIQKNAPQRMFSDAPLPFGGLKAADANLQISIAELPAGSIELKKITTHLLLKDGHLFLSPLTMDLGQGSVNGQINLDAGAPPAKFGMTLAVRDVDFGDIIKAGGAEAFLSGKARADLNLAGSGNSAHELASNLSGTIAVVGAGGDVVSAAQDQISAGIAQILSPGANADRSVNCLVARFIAQNGTVKGNGILIDTGAATAAGYGDVDLRSETLNMDFYGKPKMVDVGGLLPPVHIGGTLLNPRLSANAASVVGTVGALLTGGAVNDSVPDLATRQGQNACAYALDHPAASAAPAQKDGAVQKLAGKAGNLIRGLFGQ